MMGQLFTIGTTTFEKTLTSFKAPAMAVNSNTTVNETNRVNETTLQNTLNRLATSANAGVNESTSHNSTAGVNQTTPLNMTTGMNKTTPLNMTASAIVMLPSTARDYSNKDPKTLTLDFINRTGPDSIGNYWVKGEAVNNGNSTLQNLKITAHWFDAGKKIIGVTYGYTDKLNTSLNPGDKSTFSIMADGHNDLIGTPRFVELSYDWQ